jgi:hypothetical protein
VNEDTERWLPVAGYVNWYEVSDLGRVRSLNRLVRYRHGMRLIPGQVLKPWLQNGGYPMVSLYRNGDREARTVHSLVLEAFIGECPSGQEARHGLAGKSVVTLANLSYGTKAENEADKIRDGTLTYGERNGMVKLTEADVHAIRAAAGVSQQVLARQFGVSRSNISMIVSRKNWAHIT